MSRNVLIMLLILPTLFIPAVSGADPLDNWHWRNPLPQGNDLYGITYGNNMFIAVGDRSILTSSDGVQWTERYPGGSATLGNVVYGNNIFVAVGSSLITDSLPYYPADTILTSADGIAWTAIGNDKFDSSAGGISGVAYGGNTFVAIGKYGAGDDWSARTDSKILTSSDGASWDRIIWEDGNLAGIAYGNNIFVAIGGDGLILTSADGKKWTRRHSPDNYDLRGISYGNNIFVAAGAQGVILTSSDGKKWTKRKTTASGSSYFYGVAYGSSTFVAVGSDISDYTDHGVIMTSSDGIQWTAKNTSAGGLYGAASGGNSFVVVGDEGGIMQSDIIYPTLSVSMSGKGTGVITSSDGKIICGNECTATYSSVTDVTLATIPVTGYIFSSWSGDCSGTGTCTVTMDSSKTVTAEFKVPDQYTLKIKLVNSKHGTVTSDDGGINCGSGNKDCIQKPYYEGSNTGVTLTATPATGYTLKGWSGDGCTGTGTCSVTMDGNKTVTARFKKIK